MADGWLQEVARNGVRPHMQELGLTPNRSGRSAGPCPSCRADKRGADDPRGPIGFGGDGKSWACHSSGCDAAGDLADLLAYTMHGKRVRDLAPNQTGSLKAEAIRRGWCGLEHTARAAKAGHSVRTAGEIVRGKRKSTKPHVSGGKATGGPFDWRDSLPGGACKFLWGESPAAGVVLDYLRNERGFSDDVIRRWGLGAMPIARDGKVVEVWLTIPYLDDTGAPCNVKFRRVPGPCLGCSPDGQQPGPGCSACKRSKVPGMVPEKPKYRVCPARPMPLFARKNLKQPDRPVIVVGGELDVIAMDEFGWGQNVVASTAGEGAWADPWLDVLEPFPSFLLAHDDDEAGDDGAEKLGEKIGRYRCGRVRLPENDVNTCLVKGITHAQLQAALGSATSLLGINVVSPSSFTAEMERLINNPTQLIGLQTSSPKINSALGGLLPGLYVGTGETGEGKTTLITWLCWELAGYANEPCLLTSFEQRPIGTIQKVLRMQLGGDFTKYTAAERAAALAALDTRGIHVLDRYGEIESDELIDACRYSRRRLGIRVQMLDHLDFLARSRRPGESEREAKERIVRDLAVIGVEEDIIFFLVAHPNNLSKMQQRRVELGDLKGASAIRQDCHAGFVVEKLPPSNARPFPATCIYFDKVRSEFGAAGSKRVMAFDPVSLVYADDWASTPAGGKGLKIVVP